MRLAMRAALILVTAVLAFLAIGISKRKDKGAHPWYHTLYYRDAGTWCALMTLVLWLSVPLLVPVCLGKAPDVLMIPMVLLAISKISLINRKLWWKNGHCFYRSMTGREIRRNFSRIRLVRMMAKADHGCLLLVIGWRLVLLTGVSAEKCRRFVADYEAWREKNAAPKARGRAAGKGIHPSLGFCFFMLASLAFLTMGLACAVLGAAALTRGIAGDADWIGSTGMNRFILRILGAGLAGLGLCLFRRQEQQEEAKDRQEGKERVWQRSTGVKTWN